MNRELLYYRRTSTRWMIDESYVRFTRFPRKFDACRRGINLNNLHFALETSVQRSHGVLYIPYDGQEIPFRQYEVLVQS
ncbi:hypothetical protein HZH68_014102 [Vespula germanica]|uniref:Uncharacterized protein n=1 Tax=Vespula germanica TaxID=30212 RepID=A0A834JAJ4_VESGE|nr:hypothetical protein HZH68_014102 [Vespula germanica]